MNHVIFEKLSDRSYSPIKYISLNIDILINFLNTDVGSDSKAWIEWLHDPQHMYTSSNATFISKDENDMIELYDVLEEEVDLDKCACFRLKKSKLIELLQTWEQLNKEKPNFIVITIDGENISMQGKDSIF